MLTARSKESDSVVLFDWDSPYGEGWFYIDLASLYHGPFETEHDALEAYAKYMSAYTKYLAE
jgi:hypothetical protein